MGARRNAGGIGGRIVMMHGAGFEGAWFSISECSFYCGASGPRTRRGGDVDGEMEDGGGGSVGGGQMV